MAQDSSTANFKLADGHGYMLDRSHIAACRLNLQHFLWKEVFQFSIHPAIQLPVDRPVHIADVAAGTGLWLIDVARELPAAQLDGLDIDLTQAPHPRWLPPNITLRQWNIFEDVPSDLVGKYDLVHVRLLVLVLSALDPKPVIRNLLQLVKHGGYLQWDELDCVNMHVKKVDPSVRAPALEELCKMSYSDGRHDWVLDLPQLLMQEGFHDAQLEYYGDKPELVRAFNDQHLLTMDEFAAGLMRINKQEAAAKFYQLIRDGYQECVDGAAFCIPRVVIVAKKPNN
ncbi:hypothetical protein VTN77DRAFT_4259 [Rasamsonia byssochlamydoides]|uniref:uncharacterized protein n=1 Tax=Rasamsonia byssochlamydoides TaxID=89139 RepID=UPI003743D860